MAEYLKIPKYRPAFAQYIVCQYVYFSEKIDFLEFFRILKIGNTEKNDFFASVKQIRNILNSKF